MFKYTLGEGAELRILQKRHAQEFLDFVAENREFLGEWLGWAKRIADVEAAEKFIKRGSERFASDGLPWAGIWQNGRMAGGVLFFPIDHPIKSTEIGYWLGQDFTGRGLMTRSVKAMLRFAFDEMHLNRVGLLADVANSASCAVAERVGFTKEGIKRDGWIDSDGETYVDMAMYAMLKREWAKLK